MWEVFWGVLLALIAFAALPALITGLGAGVAGVFWVLGWIIKLPFKLLASIWTWLENEVHRKWGFFQKVRSVFYVPAMGFFIFTALTAKTKPDEEFMILMPIGLVFYFGLMSAILIKKLEVWFRDLNCKNQINKTDDSSKAA